MGEDPEKRSVPPTHAQNYTPKNVDNRDEILDDLETLRAKLRGKHT